jgi:hypothetical protein
MITYPNAVDENGDVHNIGSITPENRAEHKYYCLGCDKEMVPVLCKDKTDHFRHKVNDLCNPETYLHNLAKKYLAKMFETQKKFEVSYYATNECPKKETCQLYQQFHWMECSGTTLHTFDLKEQYDTCQIEGVYNGYRADVLLTSSQNPDTPPVFLEVSVSHDCTPEKLQSGIRIIEMKIIREADFKRPIVENKGPMVPVREEPKPQYSFYRYYSHPEPEPSFIMFHNFDREFERDNIKKLDRFALMADGRMLCKDDDVSCGELGTKHSRDSLLEIKLLNPNKEWGIRPKFDLFNLGIAQALTRDLPARHCVYCARFRNCRIPIEEERFDYRIRKNVKVKVWVLNRNVNEDKVNKFKFASSCRNWNLNKSKCENVISSYRDNNVFIWEKAKEE